MSVSDNECCADDCFLRQKPQVERLQPSFAAGRRLHKTVEYQCHVPRRSHISAVHGPPMLTLYLPSRAIPGSSAPRSARL